jgi:hypothetical protein
MIKKRRHQLRHPTMTGNRVRYWRKRSEKSVPFHVRRIIVARVQNDHWSIAKLTMLMVIPQTIRSNTTSTKVVVLPLLRIALPKLHPSSDRTAKLAASTKDERLSLEVMIHAGSQKPVRRNDMHAHDV